MASLKEANGDWSLEEGVLAVTSVVEEPELWILASDEEGQQWDFSLGGTTTGSSLQSLVGCEVSKLVALAGGELRLEFSDGTVLTVSPRDDVEAWEMRRGGESVLIGLPTGGGVLAV